MILHILCSCVPDIILHILCSCVPDIILHILCCCVSESQEVCVGGTFRARCGPDEVIVMDTAQYGRMEVGKCIRKEQQHMGCTNEVSNGQRSEVRGYL